jgi:sirohydrochlorin ferrochelatase
VIVVLLLWFRGAEIAIAVALSLGFAFAGYVLMTRRFLSREDSRPVPELTRAKGDSGLGHTAVIYFTHGEPETYDPIGWINQFNEWDEQGVPAVPFLVRPFFFHRLRKKYLEVGKSHHRGEHAQMLRSLERAFRAEGDNTTKFYLSFLDDNPRPDAAVVEALNDGASRVLVSEVFLTISNHTAEGKELIEALGVEGYGVPIEYTGPLYDSETLKRMFVQRANASLDGLEKSKVGVLLVGHGQPDEWDIEWPTETEHEMAFRHDILELLAEDGFDRQKLDLAWMEFKKPRPAAKVEEFVRNGVRRVLYFSAAISADGIHSQWDVPALVNKAQVPPDVALVNLGAWNNDPLVIQAIKEKIDRLMHGEPQQG